MKLLAIDTATEACSAALMMNGEISERYEVVTNQHSKKILPMIDELLAEAQLKPADLDCLAFGRGPGSFTGIRIATGVIQGIAFALDLPVVPVSNLAAMAQDFFDYQDGNTALVAMDARMGEIYWAVYQKNALQIAELVGDESVATAASIKQPTGVGVGIGTGWSLYRHALTAQLEHHVSHIMPPALPRARAIARLGETGFNQGTFVTAELALPVYLRDKVAKTELERR